MTLTKGMFSSLTDEWNTPTSLRELIDDEFLTEFDPCRGGDLADRVGLLVPWPGRVFCNPPYGKALPRWIEKGALEVDAGRAELIVWLLPARTDTRWFHDYVLPRASEIRFIKGRIHFENGEGRSGPAPFPSMIVIWRPDVNGPPAIRVPSPSMSPKPVNEAVQLTDGGSP